MRIVVIVVVVAAVAAVYFSSACGSSASQTEWVLTEEPAGDVLHLSMVIGNFCKSFDRIDVVETPDLVEVSTHVKSHCEGGPDILQTEDHEVHLDAPLANRNLQGCDPPGFNYIRGDDLTDCRSVR